MDSTDGRARPVLVADDVEFDGRDASLFREIARTGSVARASSNLGRSRARALTRIETLEAAFGELVDRQRGGQTGGGSRLSENANQLLDRFDRVRAAVTASAQVPETVLRGS
ncbi:MAG: LysR family transcriptional regulator, partial [Natronomonas sp.]